MFGKQFGKIFIGVQPTFGYEGDPMRLLFSRSASPHHGFAAYYTFLEKIFKVSYWLASRSLSASCAQLAGLTASCIDACIRCCCSITLAGTTEGIDITWPGNAASPMQSIPLSLRRAW